MIRLFLTYFVVATSLLICQVTASENDKQDLTTPAPNLTSVSSERTSLRQAAIQFYARNYGVINFAIISTTAFVCGFLYCPGIKNYVNRQRQREQEESFKARLKAEFDKDHERCTVIANECCAVNECNETYKNPMCIQLVTDCVMEIIRGEVFREVTELYKR